MANNNDRQDRLAIFVALCLVVPMLMVTFLNRRAAITQPRRQHRRSTLAKVDADRPPNVILLYAEDLGWGDLGCYGHPYAETPNIDRLASEGTLFKRYYSSGKTCSPARAGLMTSKYPASMKNYSGDFGFQGLDTITGLLKDAGYRTGHVGKWHIGPDDERKSGVYGIDFVKQIGGCAGDPYYKDSCVYNAAVDFIKENKDKPFYLNVWGHVAHSSIKPPSKLVDRYQDIEVKVDDFGRQMHAKLEKSAQIGNLNISMHNYLGGLYSMDYNVGKILDTIEDLGLREDTIIVFSADHGAADVDEDNQSYPENMLGYCGGLKGYKHGYYEGGLRIPFIVSWPNKVPARRIDDTTVMSSLDWLPTVCALAEGCSIDKDSFEGEDFSDVWLGGRSRFSRRNELYWNKEGENDFAMLSKNGKFKLHFTDDKKWELYNLKSNKAEEVNVIESHRMLAASMKAKLRRWARTLPDEFCRIKGCDKANLEDLNQ